MSTLARCAESERVKAKVCEVERVDDDGEQGEDIEEKSEAVVDGIPDISLSLSCCQACLVLSPGGESFSGFELVKNKVHPSLPLHVFTFRVSIF